MRSQRSMLSQRMALALVFGTSFCVLVLEILAGRLLAPLIGISLESFTGIIGTVLAGIALGTAVGGRVADAVDPGPLIGPTVLVGGVLSWLPPMLVAVLEPIGGPDPATIVFLTVVTFFAPAAVLSAVTPMVAKLRLRHLDETGQVVGNLSAAGTAGALAGTFLTGFVLVAALPTRTLIFGVGLALVVAGAALTGWDRVRVNGAAAILVVGIGAGALAVPSRCDVETRYACVEIVADPDRPSGRALVLNGVRNSYVDLEDPTYLDFRYMRLLADVVAGLPPGPIDALHLGGAGLTIPRHLASTRPGSTGTVLEIDDGLLDVARRDLGLTATEGLSMVTGDARLTIADLPDDRYDLVIGDAFSGLTIPWHLTTEEFVGSLDRVMGDGAVVAANLIDGGDRAFARAELATYRTRFEHVTVIVPSDDPDDDRPRNLILIASHRPLPALDVDPEDGRLLTEDETTALIGGAEVLTDDFAPVDQLRQR